ncbi:hypothetical protein ABIC28_001377 [Rhodococcus sp. PvR044]|jgi:hypothetical protein|nr:MULTISPECIES: hypothetical protein [Rhodococcus]AQA21235.1 hypothetical protein BTZ20_0164 [Rhodococcus sp. MTM3W5.2]MBP1161606.1 hypothetical protein [Rhodococcus sp. PvR099]MCZ4555764.1 hypothetical protein [Rhodococcus maanshanensis]PTR44770.1 hypothetical protein C8K38_103267 [Rhodococcus sp. OK611]SNX90211.1 hypothetical protein SAMN05447004_104267 [Rhodococcus sp. OK270]
MGSATDALEWIREGYLAGDPLRSALFVGASFITMPLQLIATMLGRPF